MMIILILCLYDMPSLYDMPHCRLFWARTLFFFFFSGCVISPVVGDSGGFGREISALNTSYYKLGGNRICIAVMQLSIHLCL